jgi:hypothetical protein
MIGGGEHKVKAVLNIGGEISSTLKSSVNLVTGNISRIGTMANKAIKGQFRESVVSAEKSIKDLKNEINRTGDASGTLAKKLEAATSMHDRAKRTEQSYRSLGASVGKFATGLAVVTAEATVAGWAIFHLTEKYQDHVLAMRAGGKVLSLTTQSYAALHSAAGKYADVTENAFKLFQGNVMGGNKKTLSALAAIGIDPNSLKGQTNLEAFLRVADKLKAAADKGQSVTGIARDIMGRGGPDALPFLLRGRADIERRMKEARLMGTVPSDKDVEGADEDSKVMDSLRLAMLGMKLSIGSAFQPVMDKLGFTISQFMVKHGPEFRKVMDDLGAAIEERIPTVDELKGAMDSLGNAIKWAKEHTTALKFILGAIVAMPFLPFLASLLNVASALKEIGLYRGVAKGLSMSLKELGLTALPLARLGVQLFVIAEGYKAILNIAKEWNENKGILTDLSAWKAYGKSFLQNDPILKNFLGPKSDDEEIARMRKTMPGSGSRPDPSAVFRTPSPAALGTKTFNNVFHFNVNAAPGMDAHSVADMVMNKLDGRMNAMASGALFD